jgi:hypothetical protein
LEDTTFGLVLCKLVIYSENLAKLYNI